MGAAALLVIGEFETFEAAKADYGIAHGDDCEVLGTTEHPDGRRALAVFCDCGLLKPTEG